jgi:glycosyltransferase involved in cell wall biosynthesis
MRIGRRLANYLSFCISSLVIGVLTLPRLDYLLTESPPVFLALTGWLLARLKGARWILNISDLWLESVKDFGLLKEQGLSYRALKWMARFLYRRAWLITGQSREIIAEIQKQVPWARVHHLSNGVDPHSFHPKRRKEWVRNRYVRKGEVGFLFAGLHGFFQGLDQVLQVAEELRGEPIRFVLLGDGPEKRALMGKSARLKITNVDFYPPIPNSQIPAVLASLDVAFVPLKASIRGSVPSKIYEAMASGIPILLLANGEAREIVLNAGAGVAVAPGDIKGLVETIRDIALRPEWRRKMGEAGRRAAEEIYDRRRIADCFESLLLEGEGRRGETHR